MEPLFKQIIEEFYANAKGVFEKVDEKSLQQIVSLITQVKKIYVLGIGHSGMFARILSMKLNHVGLSAYTVFDEINPPIAKGDLFIAISQSGQTKTVIALVEKAKSIGSQVLGISANADSTLAKISDVFLKIDKKAEGVRFTALSGIGEKKHENLSGTLFGFNMYVLFYTLVIMIAQQRGETAESIDARHQNLQ